MDWADVFAGGTIGIAAVVCDHLLQALGRRRDRLAANSVDFSVQYDVEAHDDQFGVVVLLGHKGEAAITIREVHFEFYYTILVLALDGGHAGELFHKGEDRRYIADGWIGRALCGMLTADVEQRAELILVVKHAWGAWRQIVPDSEIECWLETIAKAESDQE